MNEQMSAEQRVQKVFPCNCGGRNSEPGVHDPERPCSWWAEMESMVEQAEHAAAEKAKAERDTEWTICLNFDTADGALTPQRAAIEVEANRDADVAIAAEKAREERDKEWQSALGTNAPPGTEPKDVAEFLSFGRSERIREAREDAIEECAAFLEGANGSAWFCLNHAAALRKLKERKG